MIVTCLGERTVVMGDETATATLGATETEMTEAEEGMMMINEIGTDGIVITTTAIGVDIGIETGKADGEIGTDEIRVSWYDSFTLLP